MDHETWRFINTFAPWLSAAGTIAAVITSLWLARRDRRVRLEVSAGYRIIITEGSDERPEYALIQVTNTGTRKAQITGIGWQVGIIKKKYAHQIPPIPGVSSKLPVVLSDGEEARYLFTFDAPAYWLTGFVKTLPEVGHPWKSRFVKVIIYTSIGKRFKKGIEEGLRQKLIEAGSEKTDRL